MSYRIQHALGFGVGQVRPIKQPPSLECIACVTLVLLLSIAAITYGVKRYVASSNMPSYRVWEYTNIWANESGAVRKCVMEAPDAETAYRNMQALGLKYDPDASMRPCVLHRTRLVALERVP